MSSQPAPAAAAAPAARASAASRVLAGTALAVLSGLLGLLAQPPFELWALIFVAFVPMVWAQHRLVPPAFAPAVPAIAIATFLVTQITPGLIQGGVAWYYHAFPLVIGALITLLGWPGRHFHARTRYRWLSVSFPLAWVAVDAARVFTGHETLGGTWGMPVYGLYEQAWLLQPLSVVGIFGLELLVLAINFALAHLLIAWLDERRPPAGVAAARRPALVSAAVVGAVSLAWVTASLVQFAGADPRPSDPALAGPDGASLRVATVQANSFHDPEIEFERLIEGTRRAAAEGAELIVWREGGLKFDPQRERTGELRSLAAETGAYLAIGYGVTEPDSLRRNEAVVLAPDGRFFGPYGKDHPGRFAGDHSDTGGEYKVYDTGLGRIATIICYDLDFTDTARAMVRRGAEFIAVPSNDPPAIARTHYTHLVYRAIENGIAMAKADSMSDAAIIDPYGRILERIVHPFGAAEAREASETLRLPPQILVADVPKRDRLTLYARFGDWAGWLAIGGALLIFATHPIRRGRRERP
ncbi:MAG TPA: nitrilase-related carbon-nitrogen hydrolase [Pseudomonadales bacterium]